MSRRKSAPATFQGTAHVLYRNNRDGTFTDVSRESGLRLDPASGKGLGVVIVDVNDDRRPDIYAVNDTTMNLLYLNDSVPGKLRFREAGLSSGVALGWHGRVNGSMGVDAADYNGTGRASLWVTAFERERHSLYRNVSNRDGVLFQYKTQEAGIRHWGRATSGSAPGFSIWTTTAGKIWSLPTDTFGAIPPALHYGKRRSF